MSVDIKQEVDTNSTKFQEGIEAGRTSGDGATNWKPSNGFGPGLNEGEKKASVYENTFKKYPTPLFIRQSPSGRMANLQDEKDETEE